MADGSVVVRDGDDDDESKIVTKFLLDTCRAQRPFRHRAQATAVCSVFVAQLPPPPLDDKTCFVPLVTGSSAEFYIQPALSCVGDVAVLQMQCMYRPVIPSFSFCIFHIEISTVLESRACR